MGWLSHNDWITLLVGGGLLFHVLLLAAEKPNLIYVLADDLGYGDVQCLNPNRGKIQTPNLDRLAAEGMIFTNAHSGSSVCTPTRYGILTGRYAWRTRLQNGTLGGYSSPLISEQRLTVPKLLKDRGYHTACFGKWHLGWDWGCQAVRSDPDGDSSVEGGSVDYRAPIVGGPVDRGFDAFFGIVASLDMPPFVWIQDRLPTEIADVTKTFGRTGPAGKTFEAIGVLPEIAAHTITYIRKRAAPAKAGNPFFAYVALTSPHTPILPAAEWRGKSSLGAYGDFVMMTDAVVGEILAALDQAGLAQSTLVIFTSDNGCSPMAGFDLLGKRNYFERVIQRLSGSRATGTKMLEARGHFASECSRGYKSDIWDGGHHVPFFVRWPGVVKPKSQSSQLICLTDLMATCAELLAVELPENAAEDSMSFLPILAGSAGKSVREVVVHHSIDGKFAIRMGCWKLCLCAGSGGWGRGETTSPQLYDMNTDPGEMKNLASQHPDVVADLSGLLKKYVSEGRSTPGSQQRIDVKVELW